MSRMNRTMMFVCLLFLAPWQAMAYPIDGSVETGIMRLEGYRQAQLGHVPGNRLSAGARLASDQIRLRMQEHDRVQLPAANQKLTKEIIRLLGDEADDYSISVLDLSDPDHPVYAAHNDDVIRNPASVGKLVIMLSLFQSLADIYPDNIPAREKVLRESMIVADAFIHKDHHRVPFWVPADMRLQKRKLVEGDVANYWSYLDWMLSASSNAAASMVLKHVMLLRHYGAAYPVGRAAERAYFEQTSRKQLSSALKLALREPLLQNRLDPERFRQGGFFSRFGKQRVPGTTSIMTTRELMHFCLLMEQGQLVDGWSSLQMKRLIYLTQRRIRYASSAALKGAAVYFKSGSYYKCKPEAGFVCKPYMGNKLNLMNSVAIIEAPAAAPEMHYIVTVTSNVLRKNSALVQQRLATDLHQLMQGLHGTHAAPQ